MAVLVNRTQGNFTMISNNILRDEELNLKDRSRIKQNSPRREGRDQWFFEATGVAEISEHHKVQEQRRGIRVRA